MIKKTEENDKEKKKINSFKKFSDMHGTKKESTDAGSEEILPDTDDRIPGNPNLNKKSGKTPKVMDTRSIKVNPKSIPYTKEDEGINQDVAVTEENKVKLYGKVAKLPKGIKASKGYNFLENIKISKSSIWYIMVEKDSKTDGSALQLVKFNHKKGVDLGKFVNELKTYYSKTYSTNEKILKSIESIEIDGNDKYSYIRNIPLIEVEGRKMITKITEDLIKLLSK